MKIIFRSQAYQKLRAYIMGIDYEISGFGKVEKIEDNLVITDIKIFRQVVTGGSTIMDAQSLAAFWDELIVGGEDIGKWKLWWHSHVEMAAMFSGTDLNTIEDFDSEMPEENWMLSIVANKFGKMGIKVDVFEPIRCSISKIEYEVEQGIITPIDVSQEIHDKVTIDDWRHTPKISFLDEKWHLNNHHVLTDKEREHLLGVFGPQLPLFTGYRLPPGQIIDGEHLIVK